MAAVITAPPCNSLSSLCSDDLTGEADGPVSTNEDGDAEIPSGGQITPVPRIHVQPFREKYFSSRIAIVTNVRWDAVAAMGA
jgi:hypothetical protein